MAPIIEEIAFRGVIQTDVKWVSQQCLDFCQSRKETLEKWGITVQPESLQVKGIAITPTKVSILASSILFELMHDRHWTTHLAMFPIAIIWGKFADSDGISCSIAAHIAHNTISRLAIELFFSVKT
jgi:membrane protease YdiL (CAAX protease family)